MNRERGVAFVMVTHAERLAQAADRIVVIEDGVLRDLEHVWRVSWSIGNVHADVILTPPEDERVPLADVYAARPNTDLQEGHCDEVCMQRLCHTGLVWYQGGS